MQDRSDAAIGYLLLQRLILDEIATMRVLPVIRFTSFDAPSESTSAPTAGVDFFYGGKAGR